MQEFLRISKFFTLFIILILTGCSKSTEPDLVIYSARKEQLIKPLVDAYQKKTGKQVNYITDKAPVLLEKIKIEGKNTPADIYFTVDAGNLWHAKQEGVLQPIHSFSLAKTIPSHLQDPDQYWYAFSIRARTIIYNKDLISLNQLSTYEDLATEKWQGKLVLRTSKKVYNQSLVAMMIAELGIEKTKEIVKGWVRNLAQPVFSNDTKVIEAVASQKGLVGIVNTYYLARYLEKNPNSPVALFWANQNTNGVHVNITGAGITKYSKNKKEAVQFLEWLAEPEAQAIIANLNDEYPVLDTVPQSRIVKSWGDFKSNETGFENAGKFQKQAIRLMDELGYK